MIPRAAYALLFFLACPVRADSVDDSHPLDILTAAGKQHFIVERVTEKHAQNAKPLTNLEPDHGRLYLLDRPQHAAMSMKDLNMALDMLFITKDGSIVHIEDSAPPMSEATISSGMPVIAVLELPGGTARRIGAQVGDQV